MSKRSEYDYAKKKCQTFQWEYQKATGNNRNMTSQLCEWGNIEKQITDKCLSVIIWKI